MKRSKLVITYPNGDGELHIDATEMQNCVQFTFTYSNRENLKPAKVLEKAVADIAAHFARIKPTKKNKP